MHALWVALLCRPLSHQRDNGQVLQSLLMVRFGFREKDGHRPREGKPNESLVSAA